MEKPTTKLGAQDRVILFCVATGIAHGSVGIIDHAMQSMAIRGFIAHNRESGAYTLTDSGRAALTAILEDAGLKIKTATVSIAYTEPGRPISRCHRVRSASAVTAAVRFVCSPAHRKA